MKNILDTQKIKRKNMNSDSYFEIGSTHKICQDYALHGQIKNKEGFPLSYAIISDGCSEAPHSEIGAQILCHVAQYQINLLHHTGALTECGIGTLQSLLANSILTRADEIRKLYPIDKGALQATLLVALRTEIPLRRIVVFGWGDGVIIEQYPNHTQITELNFPSGAPVYLATDRIAYEAKIEDPEFIKKIYWVDKDGTSVDQKKHDPFQGSIQEFFGGTAPISVTLCSDGLKSYQDADHKSIDFVEMAQQFTDYRSSNGVFVQRCMNFLKITNKKEQRTHYDDISTASILV